MHVMSQFDLSGKVAVVTGGNGGLGEAFAHALAEAGAQVAIAARGHARSLEVVKALQQAGHRAMAVEVDITQPEAADGLLDEVEATLGPVDIFLNNAGACQHAPALDVTPERWRDIFDINVHGLWYCAQAAGRRMKSLAAEWAPYGIRVNALAPGYVKTSMAQVDDPKFKPRWIDDAPMQRAATPAELGPTIVYMASNASSFMTGSIVVVDGGYTLW